MMRVSWAKGALVDDIGGTGTLAAHAHVERAVLGEGETPLGFVELHRGHADIEHHAIDCGRCRSAPSRCSMSAKRPSSNVSRPGNAATSAAPAAIASGSRSMAKTRVSRRLQNGAAVAPCSEGAVDDGFPRPLGASAASISARITGTCRETSPGTIDIMGADAG